ncbi:MAG: LysR family transcriptional regulator [Peptococcaceae bacterium]|nr:LysR family transcriptional regulator [Peptococcaceae bacterium]
MRLEQLYYFSKIADLHSFTAASEELFISQQALSTSMKKLEKEFQTALFIRTPRGVSLTEDGQYFYERVAKIMALHEEIYNHFLRQIEAPDSLSVALNANIKRYYFPKIISHFLKNYPDNPINYISAKNNDVIDLVLNKEATFGVLPVLRADNSSLTELPEELTFLPLSSTHYCLLTDAKSPLAGYKSLSMSTIIKYPIILNASSESTLFSQLIAFYDEKAPVIHVDSIPLQEQMVEDDLGNMLYLESQATPSDKFVKILISNNISVCVGFIYRSDLDFSPLQRIYLEKAKNLIAKFH